MWFQRIKYQLSLSHLQHMRGKWNWRVSQSLLCMVFRTHSQSSYVYMTYFVYAVGSLLSFFSLYCSNQIQRPSGSHLTSLCHFSLEVSISLLYVLLIEKYLLSVTVWRTYLTILFLSCWSQIDCSKSILWEIAFSTSINVLENADHFFFFLAGCRMWASCVFYSHQNHFALHIQDILGL